MPSLIPLDDFSQRNTASNMPQPAGKRLIPISAPAKQAPPPAAPSPAKRIGKSRTVSWLGETGLEVVGEYKHPGGLTSQVVSYPAPTPQDPGKRIFLATPAPGPGGGPRTSPAGSPQVVEKAPDGTFKKVGSFRPADAPSEYVHEPRFGRPGQNAPAMPSLDQILTIGASSVRPAAPQEQGDAAPAQAAAQQPAAQDIQSLMRNRQTLEQWKARRPEEVAALERDYSTWAEIKDRNPMLALSYGRAAKERYAKLMAELGAPDQFVTQRKQVELGMLSPPQLVMNQGPGGAASGMQTLQGSDTQGMQASELGGGVGEQAAAMDDARAREAYQRGQVSGNSGVRALQAFGTGVESVAGGAARLLPDVQGWTDDATLNEVSRNQQSFSQANAAQAGGAGKVVQGIAQSYGVVAPGAAIGAATGGAATGMALAAGLSQYGQSYQQATDAGLRGADRQAFAATNAAAESLMSIAFTKLLKMPGLEGAFVKSGLQPRTVKAAIWEAAKRVGVSGLEEFPEEITTQLAQNLNARLSGVDPTKAVLTGDEIYDIALQTFGAAGGASLVGGGHLGSVKRAMNIASTVRQNGKAYVEPANGAADWVKSHPEAAEEIVAAVKEGKPISRSMMEANALPVMDSVKRSQWAAKVYDAVANPVTQAAAANTTADAAQPAEADVSQNPIPTEIQRSEQIRAAVDAERASQAAAVRNLGPEYEQRAQAIESGSEDAAIEQDVQRRMAEEESAPFSNSPKPRGPQFVNTAQPIDIANEGSFGAPQVGDEVVDTRESEGKAGKGQRRGRVVSVDGDWATVQPKFGKQYKVPVGRLEVRGRPGTPKAKGLQEQPVGEGEDFVTPMGGSLSRNTVAPQDQQQGADASVPQPNIPQQPAQQQPTTPAQPQAEVPPTQQAEAGGSQQDSQDGVGVRTIELTEMDMEELRRKGFTNDQIAMMDDATLRRNGVARIKYNPPPLKIGEGRVKRIGKNPANNPATSATPAPPRTQQLQMVQAAFPGQKLEQHPTKPDSWLVTLRNGKFLTVEFTTDMGPISREGLRRSLEAKLRRPVTDAEIDAAQVLGRWRVSDEAGFAVDGQGLVRLNSTMATSTDAKHEALHAARSLGLFTDAEWNALKAEHAPNAKTEGDAEEAIANVAQVWSGPKGLLAKILQFFNGILSSMKVVKPSADTALKRLRSGKVFGRAGKTESREAASARLSAELGGDVRYSAEFDEDWMKDDAKSYKRLADLQDKLRKVTDSIERLPPVSELLKSNPRRSDESLQDWRNRMLSEIPQTPGQMRDELAILSEMVPLLKERVAYSKKWNDKWRGEFGKDNKDSTRLRREEIEAEKRVDEIINRGVELRGLLKEQDDSDISYAAAFHGSPHTFDKFTTAKMGTGEGAQAYGWGLYFAGSKKVAEWYREKLKPGKGASAVDTAARIYQSLPDSMSDAEKRESTIKELEGRKTRGSTLAKYRDVAPALGKDIDGFDAKMDAAIEAAKTQPLGGRLYHVDLKPAEDEYLLWDKPLSEQSERVRKALESSGIDPKARGDEIYGRFVDDAIGGENAPVNLPDPQWKSAMSDAKRVASEKLKSLGIRGIKYLDGTSRSQGEGSHNYVIFDDADVDITAMYSAELAGAEDGSAKDKAAAAKAWREQGTESPWFKRWFGGSKVVDAEGKPLVVYHGTDKDFSTFGNSGSRTAYDSGYSGRGYYFGSSKTASVYAGASSLANKPVPDGANIKPVYLSMKNPLVIQEVKGGDDQIIAVAKALGIKLPPDVNGINARRLVPTISDDIAAKLKETGHDGVIYKWSQGTEVEYMVPNANQIKSATANNGTFSPDNADIRYSAEPTQAQKERTASLANPGMSPDVRNQIDAERLQMDAPETQPLAEVQRLADAITPDQARAALASGKPVTAPEMEAARRLKESVTRNALVNRTAANLAESAKVIAQYDLIGTESARAFNIRRDRVETPFQRNQRLLGDELIGAPKSIRDAIKDALRLANEALLKGDKKTAKVERDRATKLSREGARMAEKNRAFLERIGLLPKDGDESAWNEIFGNDIKSFRLLREASALNQGYGSAIMEYWNSMLLSGPATQFRNLLGTPLNYGIEAFIERPILAAARVAIGKQSAGDTLRAANEWWKGFSLAGAWRHASDSYRQETSTFDRLFKDEDYGGLLENMDGYYSIRGLKGRVIRGLGWGPLRAADQFWKALIGGMEVGRFAYAQARSELGANAKSEDISNRMAEIMADYQSDAWEKASARSDIATFTEKGSETRHQVKQRVKALRNVVPGAKFIIPFIDTPVNIAAQTIERAPALGAIRYLFKMRDNIKNKRPTFDGFGEAAVKQLVSTAALTALLQSGLLSDDDDKYFAIRSGQHADPLKRYTFKWGDTDLSYQGLEPVASLLSLMADWNASRRSGVNPGTVIVGSTIDQIANKPMLQGLGDILQIMNPRDYGTADSKWKTMEANGLNYAKNFGASWVPAIYKQTVKALRPNAVNTRIMATDAEGKDKWTLAGKRMVEQAEIGWMLEKAGFKDPPAAQIDVFGKQKSNVILDGQSWWSNPGTDFLYRLTSPLRTTEQNAHPANELLAAWNRTKPEGAEDYKLSAVEPRYTDSKGRPSVMDEHQFEQLQKLAGGIADRLYAKGKFDPKNPTEAQVAMLTERLLPAAKEEARRLIVDSIVTGKPVAETVDQIAERVEKKVRVSVFNAASEKVKRTMNKGEVDWQRDRRVEKSLKKRDVAREQREKLRE